MLLTITVLKYYQSFKIKLTLYTTQSKNLTHLRKKKIVANHS